MYIGNKLNNYLEKLMNGIGISFLSVVLFWIITGGKTDNSVIHMISVYSMFLILIIIILHIPVVIISIIIDLIKFINGRLNK